MFSAAFFANRSFSKLLSATLMVAGTTIGAGMLGMPLITAKSGFLPAALVSVAVWVFMCITGLMLVEVCIRSPSSYNILSISKHWLGGFGRGITGCCFAFLYYCLLVAYLAAGSLLLSSFFDCDSFYCLLAFTACFAIVILKGAKSIHRANAFLTIAMFVCYIAIVFLGYSAVSIANLARMQFSLSISAMPVLFCSFGYHNIIPSLVIYNGADKRLLRASVILGTLLSLVVFLVWQWLIIGGISQDVLQQTLLAGFPVTQALQNATGKVHLYLLGQLFAFFALTSSLLGVCFSMVDFLREALGFWKKNIGKKTLAALVFCPPALCVMFNTTIFEEALGLAGGIGEAILNGFIPIALFWVSCRSAFSKENISAIRSGVIFLTIFCAFVLGVEVVNLWF